MNARTLARLALVTLASAEGALALQLLASSALSTLTTAAFWPQCAETP